MSSETSTSAAAVGADTRSATVTFITTEHFTLQGARAATIAESTGRATMFLGSVSTGLVALGLIAAATRLGATFYAFGVIVLATLSFVGLVTFERVLQSGIEDHGYAQRIARLRAFYFDCAPEITGYLVSVPPPRRLSIQGLDSGYWQGFRTIAGMVGVVTAVLGSAAGLIAAVAAGHSAVAGLRHRRRGGACHRGGLDALPEFGLEADPSTPLLRLPAGGCAAGWQRAAQPVTVAPAWPGPRRGRSSGQSPIGVEGRPASYDRKSRGNVAEVAEGGGQRVETLGGGRRTPT